MKNIRFSALVVDETDGNYVSSIKERTINDLPDNDVVIKVRYSSVNYKDALSATGNKGVTKNYPHTPGIDAAGEIIFSKDPHFAVGEEVIVTGYDLGMNTDGGWGQYISVPAEWVVKRPENLSAKEAMIIGTAGFTAGISVDRLSSIVKPEHGAVLVSGATGGVGSIAVSILSKLGYKVSAISRKAAEQDYLLSLGATDIIPVSAFTALGSKPVLSAKYAGGIDTVGGVILENMIKTTKLYGAVTTCGSVAGTQLNLSVFPFILRGTALMGISSQNYPTASRPCLWNRL
ncbi:MAG: YhdH/YhfP family quinone oxidoreductase, partial [Prevotellaceae bacterium]|nr:YhdH/YhfP family quinone oxidoreductase [Prevotellaceae bacterium]